jgi:hypothetical protein
LSSPCSSHLDNVARRVNQPQRGFAEFRLARGQQLIECVCNAPSV